MRACDGEPTRVAQTASPWIRGQVPVQDDDVVGVHAGPSRCRPSRRRPRPRRCPGRAGRRRCRRPARPDPRPPAPACSHPAPAGVTPPITSEAAGEPAAVLDADLAFPAGRAAGTRPRARDAGVTAGRVRLLHGRREPAAEEVDAIMRHQRAAGPRGRAASSLSSALVLVAAACSARLLVAAGTAGRWRACPGHRRASGGSTRAARARQRRATRTWSTSPGACAATASDARPVPPARARGLTIGHPAAGRRPRAPPTPPASTSSRPHRGQAGGRAAQRRRTWPR